MNEKYPDEGTGGENHDIDPERPGVRAAETARGQPPAPPPGIQPPPTGDTRVDAAMAELSRLPGTPPEEHVAVLEEVHGRLRAILGQLSPGELGDDGDRPGRRGPGGHGAGG